MEGEGDGTLGFVYDGQADFVEMLIRGGCMTFGHALARGIFVPFLRLPLLMQAHNATYSRSWKILTKQGFSSGWQGFGTYVISVLPVPIIEQLTQDTLIYTFVGSNPDSRLLGLKVGLALFLSTSLAQVLVYPFTLISRRLAADKRNSVFRYRGFFDCWTQTVQKEGYAALYRGMGASLCGAFVMASVTNTLYDTSTRMFVDFSDPLQSGQKFLCWVGSVLSGYLLSYPFETVTVRLQINGSEPATHKYDGIVDCFTRIVQAEGVTSLWRGLLLHAPVSSFAFLLQQFFVQRTTAFADAMLQDPDDDDY
eukprot:TRINITY_DN7709_c0_g1_i1.p1 TRINITY_DN7709_c0_g1~~TRINITY_DN7709_c0_g1_i1.p1  ORF type:complete len:317 (-),score=40.27 TRINITY_DN7709_c0_g1_i1:33-959(-)